MSPILAPGGVGEPNAQAGCSSLDELLAKAGGIVAEAECAVGKGGKGASPPPTIQSR